MNELDAIAYRMLLTTQAAGLLRAARNLRALAAGKPPREESKLVALANAHERLAGEIADALGEEAEAPHFRGHDPNFRHAADA
jgi:hypothetical protein